VILEWYDENLFGSASLASSVDGRLSKETTQAKEEHTENLENQLKLIGIKNDMPIALSCRFFSVTHPFLASVRAKRAHKNTITYFKVFGVFASQVIYVAGAKRGCYLFNHNFPDETC